MELSARAVLIQRMNRSLGGNATKVAPTVRCLADRLITEKKTRYRRSAGFSLIELVMVIVIVSIGAMTLLGSFQQVGQSILLSEDLQVGAQLAQECGEYVVISRRDATNAYTGIDANVCNGLPLPVGFNRTITLTEPFSDPACPGGATCKKVEVLITKGSDNVGSITTMVANY